MNSLNFKKITVTAWCLLADELTFSNVVQNIAYNIFCDSYRHKTDKVLFHLLNIFVSYYSKFAWACWFNLIYNVIQGIWKFFGGLKEEGSGRMICKNCSYLWKKSWPLSVCNFSGFTSPPPPNLYFWVWYCGMIMSFKQRKI